MIKVLAIFMCVLSLHMFAAPFNFNSSIIQAAHLNRDLRAAKNNVDSAQALLKGSRYNLFPQLNLNADGGFGSLRYENNPKPALTADLVLTQNLFAGLKDSAQISQARTHLSIAQAHYRTVAAKVSFDLKSALAGLTYTARLINLTQDIIKRRQNNLEIVSLRFSNGIENKGSKLLAKGYLEQAKFEHLQAIQAKRVIQEKLAAVLGDEEIQDYVFDGAMPLTQPPEDPDFSSLVQQTPDYIRAQLQEDLAKQDLILARSNFFPVIDFKAELGAGIDDIRRGYGWFVGISLYWPLFNGGRDYFASKSAKFKIMSAKSNKESVLRQGIPKLQQAYNDFVQSIQKLKADQLFAEASRVRQQIAKNKYSNGLLSFENWDIIEQDLINREKVLLQSEQARLIANSAWEQALGQGAIL